MKQHRYTLTLYGKYVHLYKGRRTLCGRRVYLTLSSPEGWPMCPRCEEIAAQKSGEGEGNE